MTLNLNTLHWQNHLVLDESKNISTLLSAESLTRCLKNLDAEFSVHLRHLGTYHDIPPETADLAWVQAGKLFVREVELCLNQTAVVWARSVCTNNASFWTSLLQCGEQSLGEHLFQNNLPWQRSPFVYAFADIEGDDAVQKHWARQSVFHLNQEPLVITEVFLPALNSFLA
ncbi:chorismate--pyruvate lyase family protein [Stenoxybacter acetivorans]|uniref:chorismate--pyruvate lyase family protein n=1 Tax=Stenoxybacter acetivorans TaxID=422441 RepID=UPI00068A39B4|nr:chorismate lyase [Stenoxybacter acetivorans]